MIIALQSDSVIMARAKGISPNRVLWVHALRMSILSLMTSVALQMAALLGGAVIAEQFFGPKGIGDRLIFAVQQNDLLVIQAHRRLSSPCSSCSPTSSSTCCTPSSTRGSASPGRLG